MKMGEKIEPWKPGYNKNECGKVKKIQVEEPNKQKFIFLLKSWKKKISKLKQSNNMPLIHLFFK